jgi:DNA invertase Pin-like site-specific DNA recombinase/predicted Zn-ribbon and HTH transcriptional regulator
MGNTVAIYCRLSREDLEKSKSSENSESIENQKIILKAFALEKNWKVFRVYSDDDFSGTDRSRPGFNELLKDAESRKFNIILCKSQSRFSRELEIVEKYINGLFLIWGIRFVSVTDNIDTEERENKKSRKIHGLINEWFLEDLSNNIKSVLDSKRKNGVHIGSFAPYGYFKDPKLKGRLIIDENAAKIIREIFDLYLIGNGVTNIAKILNKRKIPIPTAYKQSLGMKIRSHIFKTRKLWTRWPITRILNNEVYIGNMVQGKQGTISFKNPKKKTKPKTQWFTVKNTHEPIIDPETWKYVQNRLKQRSRAFKSGEIGIFSRKTRCKFCGYTMRSQTSSKKYLRCPTRIISKDACIGSRIEVKKLEEIILKNLKNFDFHDNSGFLNAKIKINLQKIETLQVKLSENQKFLKQAYIDRVNNKIPIDIFAELSKDFTKQKEILTTQILKLECDTEETQVRTRTESERRKIIEEYAKKDKLTRPDIDKLIDYIVVGQNNETEIHWNF